jgi:hypothetical protein
MATMVARDKTVVIADITDVQGLDCASEMGGAAYISLCSSAVDAVCPWPMTGKGTYSDRLASDLQRMVKHLQLQIVKGREDTLAIRATKRNSVQPSHESCFTLWRTHLPYELQAVTR